MSTLREYLKKRLTVDYSKASKKFWNQNNLEMNWSDEEKLYIGIDEKKIEWIASLQQTTIPIFSVPCPNLVRKGNVEVECKSVNFIPICNNEEIKCRKCNKSFTPKYDISETSQAYEIFNNLDKNK